MGKLNSLKEKAKQLKGQLTSIYYAYQDPRVPWLPKLIIMVALAYALSPIDLIPDFIPVIGYLDDLIIIPALLGLAVKLIPEPVMTDARQRAEHEPVRLKKNMVFACIFIGVWLLILASVVLSIYRVTCGQ